MNHKTQDNQHYYHKPEKSAAQLKLYLVTDSSMCDKNSHGLVKTVLEAIEGGVTFVQLRDKTSNDDELIELAVNLKKAIAGSVPLIINDRVDIAKQVGLDGAHIGQSDLNVDEARKILGPDAWLGLSINNEEQLQFAHTHYLNKVDYFGFGPVFSTTTKPDHSQPLDIKGLKQLVTLSKLPNVAIGGINIKNAESVMNTGSNGIAVVSAICADNNPKSAAQQLNLKLSGVKT